MTLLGMVIYEITLKCWLNMSVKWGQLSREPQHGIPCFFFVFFVLYINHRSYLIQIFMKMVTQNGTEYRNQHMRSYLGTDGCYGIRPVAISTI